MHERSESSEGEGEKKYLGSEMRERDEGCESRARLRRGLIVGACGEGGSVYETMRTEVNVIYK